MKKLLSLLALIPLGLFAQNVHVNYQDGKIWFKLNDEIRISASLKENPSKIPVQSIPGLEQIVSKYGFVNLSKPFYAATGSKILQRTYLLEFSAVQDVERCIKDLQAMKGMDYAEKVPLDRLCLTPNDPSYSSQWGLANINAPTAWNYFSAGSNIVVAVVDDAIERTHSDLSPNLWVNPGEIPGNGSMMTTTDTSTISTDTMWEATTTTRIRRATPTTMERTLPELYLHGPTTVWV